MQQKNYRNISYAPHLQSEGTFTAPLPSPPPVPAEQLWYANLSTHDRLFYHHTLSSVRRTKRFVQTVNIAQDALDLQLYSRYDHSQEAFPKKVDMVMQTDTCSDGAESGRMLRNIEKVIIPKTNGYLGHPIRFGGIPEKISPHSVKLIDSGLHNHLGKNGYSRHSSDGNFFSY